MNKVLIVDASESDRRLMAGLLVKSGYETIAVETMEAAKDEVAKLPPGAVIVADAIVNNLNGPDLLEVMKGGGAVDVVQRAGIDKQLVETVGKYAKPENIVIQLDNALILGEVTAFVKSERQSDELRPLTPTVSFSAKVVWARSRLHDRSISKVRGHRSR